MKNSMIKIGNGITLLILTVLQLRTIVIPNFFSNQETAVVNSDTQLSEFTTSQLAEFDGTNPQKPIYIGMDGLVYDVTEGKKYYQTNGAYHSLAGKDSSEELHKAGGEIIKRKYPVIGKVIQE